MVHKATIRRSVPQSGTIQKVPVLQDTFDVLSKGLKWHGCKDQQQQIELFKHATDNVDNNEFTVLSLRFIGPLFRK